MGFQSWRLVDTSVIRTRDGEGAEVSGMAPSQPGLPAEAPRMVVQLRIGQAKIEAAGTSRAIRIDRLRAGVRVPYAAETSAQGKTQWQFIETGLNTDLDVREGQKAIVGKSTVDGSNEAIVMALSARVVE